MNLMKNQSTCSRCAVAMRPFVIGCWALIFLAAAIISRQAAAERLPEELRDVVDQFKAAGSSVELQKVKPKIFGSNVKLESVKEDVDSEYEIDPCGSSVTVSLAQFLTPIEFSVDSEGSASLSVSVPGVSFSTDGDTHEVEKTTAGLLPFVQISERKVYQDGKKVAIVDSKGANLWVFSASHVEVSTPNGTVTQEIDEVSFLGVSYIRGSERVGSEVIPVTRDVKFTFSVNTPVLKIKIEKKATGVISKLFGKFFDKEWVGEYKMGGASDQDMSEFLAGVEAPNGPVGKLKKEFGINYSIRKAIKDKVKSAFFGDSDHKEDDSTPKLLYHRPLNPEGESELRADGYRDEREKHAPLEGVDKEVQKAVLTFIQKCTAKDISFYDVVKKAMKKDEEAKKRMEEEFGKQVENNTAM